MKIHEVDNSLNNLGKAVLWQYDRAVRLLSVMKHMQVLYHCAVEQFWDFWTSKLLAIDTCGAFGCSVWGIFLGVPRPTVKDENGKDRLIATSVYRKILKGAFYLMKATSSFDSIVGYLEIIFGIGGDENLSKWFVTVSEYGWTTNIDELNDVYKSGVAYRNGDIFSFDRMGDGTLSNWKCLKDISIDENTSFEAIADYVTATNEPTNGMGADETLLLKLYDPEGICRKIGGAPKNSLSISVEYEFGNTTIKAEATRRRKCGVTLTDNQDLSMEYGKSEYYDEMHRDQKAIFEQKMMDFCPFPLGIKTNEPVGRWTFGFSGQTPPMYVVGESFTKGQIFGYVIDDYRCSNYVCLEDITAEENTSFDAIADKVEKTHDGGPLIQSFGEMTPPYIDPSRFYSKFYAGNRFYYNTVGDYDMVTVIPWRCMFVGLENGMLKIFKNTTDRTLFILWDKPKNPNNLTGYIYADVFYEEADTSSPESHLESMARIARAHGCPVIPYGIAIVPQADTYYSVGSTIYVDGKPRTFNSSIRTSKGEGFLQEIINASSPESNAGMHDWYPYKI